MFPTEQAGGDIGAGRGKRMPPLFAFFIAFSPFLVFLFEFGAAPKIFSAAQLAAIAFLVFVYFASAISGHKGIARIAVVLVAFLALPPLASRAMALLLASTPLVIPDILYYASYFISLIAAAVYLVLSGAGRHQLFFAACRDRRAWLYAAVFAAGSILALAAYFKLSGVPMSLPSSPSPGIALLLALLFAAANSAMEELWFRSLLLGALGMSFPARFALIYQAVLFGAIHWDGTPFGPSGIALTFVFAIAAGWITLRAKSILPALMLHFCADLFIAFYF